MKIFVEAIKIRNQLKSEHDCIENPIDDTLPIIPPFDGLGNIKLIVIGQDPTVKNNNSRSKISCTLNLDKNNSLKRYIEQICFGLGMDLENVYATNIFKYFYTVPPAKTMKVLYQHLEPNLQLLDAELANYKNAIIITLGEPVLKLLTDDKNKVRKYWDYDVKTGISNMKFSFVEAKENKLGRDFYPFPHQPSLRKDFYRNTLNDYLKFVQ